MKKLYTEQQYREYSKLMEKMANLDDMFEGVNIHFEIKEWLESNKISEAALIQMDKRMEQECRDEMNGVEKKGMVIDFPSK